MSKAIANEMAARAWFMLLMLSVIWGGSFYFNAILVREFQPMTIVFLRVFLAAVFLWVYIGIKGIAEPKALAAWSALFVMGLLNIVFLFSLIV